MKNVTKTLLETGPAEIHDMAGKKAFFCSAYHFVGDESCSKTSCGILCQTTIPHTQDFDRLSSQKRVQISEFLISQSCHT